MADIFLSYTEKDRDIARRMAAMLGSAGWTVWWDRRIPAGETWRSVLEHALENMRCMVVLWSAHSIESEWVYEEASEGRRLGRLVPVLIEAVRPPAGFREIQAADLAGWDGSSEFEGMKMLLADLENILGKPTPGAANASASPGENRSVRAGTAADRGRRYPRPVVHSDATPPRHEAPRRFPLWAVAGVLLLAGGAAYLSLPWREASIAPPPEPESARQSPSKTAPPPATSAPSATTEPPRAETPADAAARPSPIAKKVAPAARPASARCADLLARLQLGETLSDEAQARFRKECSQ